MKAWVIRDCEQVERNRSVSVSRILCLGDQKHIQYGAFLSPCWASLPRGRARIECYSGPVTLDELCPHCSLGRTDLPEMEISFAHVAINEFTSGKSVAFLAWK